MLNERTYIGILPRQQRQSATDLCVDELSRTYTSGLLSYLVPSNGSVSNLPRVETLSGTRWISKQLDVSRRRSLFDLPLNFKTSSPVAVVIVVRFSCRSPRRFAFQVIVANLLTELMYDIAVSRNVIAQKNALCFNRANWTVSYMTIEL